MNRGQEAKYRSLPRPARNVRVKSQPDFSTLSSRKHRTAHQKFRKSVSPSCIQRLSGKRVCCCDLTKKTLPPVLNKTNRADPKTKYWTMEYVCLHFKNGISTV